MAVDATRDAGNRWAFAEHITDRLEPWNGVRMVCLAASDRPTRGVDVTEFINNDPDTVWRTRAKA